MSESKSHTGWYVAAGCLGAAILFLVIVFAALFYFGFVQRGGVYDDLRVSLAKSQLNSLISHIELYQKANGIYPNSLEDLVDFVPEDSFVLIHDPSAPPLGDGRLFYYERIEDDHYILRGVGVDGTPFTDDDLIPDGYTPSQTGLLLEKVD